jgi:hypothetical protein
MLVDMPLVKTVGPGVLSRRLHPKVRRPFFEKIPSEGRNGRDRSSEKTLATIPSRQSRPLLPETRERLCSHVDRFSYARDLPDGVVRAPSTLTIATNSPLEGLNRS